MAHARLHIICGNCGCNTEFDYKIKTEINDDTNEKYQVVYICCNNCSTLHVLDDNAKRNETNTN